MYLLIIIGAIAAHTAAIIIQGIIFCDHDELKLTFPILSRQNTVNEKVMVEESDVNVGFWLKDVPYFFIPGEFGIAQRIYIAPPGMNQDTIRKFTSKIVDSKISRCGRVQNYFYAPAKSELGKFFPLNHMVNGRVAYKAPGALLLELSLPPTLLDGMTVIDNIPMSLHSSLPRELYEFSGIEFDLASIICTSSGSKDRKEILEQIRKCPQVSVEESSSLEARCDPCTVIGRKIARSLIRIAALRIFSDPAQSIMELPVNSIDAYFAAGQQSAFGEPKTKRPDRKIGKFGMGFFSILYWLIGHPKRSLNIQSFYRDADGKYGAYSVSIYEKSGTLAFKFQTFPFCEVTQTGTRIILEASKDKFSSQELMQFDAYIDRLRLVEGVTIWRSATNQNMMERVTSDATASTTSSSGGGNVFCIVTPIDISVEDHATGISLELLFGTLFVPSISTKTIALAGANTTIFPSFALALKSRVLPAIDKTSLSIAVGDIIVIVVVAEAQDRSETTPRTLRTFLLDLPVTTRLPVSRDDIILSSDTATIIERELLHLFFETEKELSDVSMLQTLVNEYISKTVSIENKNLFSSVLEKYYESSKSYLVPSGYPFYRKLGKYVPTYIGSNRYDVLEVQRNLESSLKLDATLQAWYGMSVVAVDDQEMGGQQLSTGGLTNYLFISKKYLEDRGYPNPGWIDSITISHVDSKLLPKTVSINQITYDTYDWKYSISETIKDSEYKRLLYALIFRVDALRTKFTFNDDVAISILVRKFIELYKIDPKCYYQVLIALLSKLGKFKGNQTYGGAKYSIGFFTAIPNTSVTSFDLTPEEPSEKWKNYLIQYYLCLIESVEEEAYTNFTLGENNSTGYIFHRLKQHSEPSSQYVEMAYERSRSYMEFFYLAAGFGRGIYSSTVTKLPRGIEKYIDESLTTIRSLNIASIEKTAQHLRNLPFFLDPTARFYEVVIGFQTFSVNWVRNMQKSPVIPTENEVGIVESRYITFGLNDLIGKLFVYPVELESAKDDVAKDDVALSAFLRSMTKKPAHPLPLQITEIAVNEGTTKSFIPAVLTELIQNSIDAIRTATKKRSTVIEITLTRLVKADGKEVLDLSISDHVGMDANAFLHISIPFLSTKTPSQIVTGEMGSGFFNVYRESEKVRIISTKDGVSREYIDTPLRKEGRVVDIKKMYSSRITTRENGTSIFIEIPFSNEYDYIKLVTEIETYTRNVLSLASHAQIIFQGEGVTIPKEKIFSFGGFDVYAIAETYTIESYITTKGIPFAPLSTLISSYFGDQWYDLYMKNNLVVDIPSGYTPSQARSKIRLDPELEKQLATLALYCAFYTSLRLENYRGAGFIQHSESTADAKQLYFARYDLTKPDKIATAPSYITYVKFLGAPAIWELINTCITTMGNRTYHQAEGDLARVLKSYHSGSATVDQMVRDVVIRWLTPKNTAVKAKSPAKPKTVMKKTTTPTPTKSPKKEIKVLAANLPRDPLQSYIEKWIEAYCTIAKKVGVVGYDKHPIPKVMVVAIEEYSHILGQFNISENTIVINSYKFDAKERKQIQKIFENGDAATIVTAITGSVLQKNTLWQTYFAYSFPATTIPHELEHYRRHAGHNSKGGHDDLHSISLYPGDKSKTRIFRSVCQ